MNLKKVIIKLSLSVIFPFIVTVPPHASAQEIPPLDTTEVYEMEQIIVTADRSESLLSSSTVAVSVIQNDLLRQQPVEHLYDALRLVPGFVFLGSGLDYHPEPTVRGFYGGGEAGYIEFLLNGKPLNKLERGTVNWNLLPVKQIRSIEVLRGGASSLYGSSAIGGAINIVTEEEEIPATQAALRGGSHDMIAGQFRHSNSWHERRYSFFGNLDRSNGYRKHATQWLGTVGGSIEIFDSSPHTLTFSSLSHWNKSDMPGPLSGTDLDISRRQISPLYRFDNTEEEFHEVTLDNELNLSEHTQLTSYVTGRLRNADVTSTLSLAPGFADTRSRELKTSRLQASTQLTAEQLLVNSELTIGVEGSLGPIETRYYDFISGTEDTYRTAVDPKRGELADRADGSRNTIASFLQYDLYPINRLRLSFGMRYDYLFDAFQSKAPEKDRRITNTHQALSPKLGVNYRYIDYENHVGNVYGNISRVFKAPTLDQFYDQRLIRLPIGDVALSNPDLDPQQGTSFELGTYQRSKLIPQILSAELSLAVYQINMRDEIDFSLQDLSYINIGESRHRGIEAGLKLYLPEQVSLFVNYTHQAVTLEKGTFSGNYVKAIPRNAFNGGISLGHSSGLSGSLLMIGAYDVYLDDANTIPLSGYTRFDLRFGYAFGKFVVTADILNLLDEEYITTGYPDPTGQTDQVFYYPASERTFRLGLTVSF